MEDGDEVVLGRAGLRTGWLLVAALGAAVAAPVLGGVAGWWPLVVAVQVVLPLAASGAGAVWLLTRRASDVLVLAEDHVATRGSAGHRRWRWDELLEVGVAASSGSRPYLAPGTTVLIRPEGRGWDVPGPNAPHQVFLPVFGRAARARVTDELRRACDQHGVPFTDAGLRMAEQPRPDSPFRRDRRSRDST